MAPNSPPPRKGERSSDATETEQDIVEQLPTIGPIASQGQLPPQHRAPVTGTDHTHLVPPTPQTPFHTPLASNQRGATHGVVSPAAAESASTEYFPSLGQAPSRSSLRSGHSAFSDLDSPALPRQPAIRIRRRGGSTGSQRSATDQAAVQSAIDQVEGGLDASGRPRSISQPERTYAGTGSANAARHSRRVPQQPMPRLTEEGNRPTMQDLGLTADGQDPNLPVPERTRSLEAAPAAEQQRGGLRRVSNFFRPRRTTVSSGSDGLPPVPASPQPQRTAADDEYDAAIVDYLDTIDPEVQTLSTLTNVQNSLFVPDLGSWLNRRPAYNLSVPAPDPQLQKPLPPPPPPTTQPPPIPEGDEDLEREKAGERVGEGEVPGRRQDLERATTITSQVSDSHYATLPHGETLEGWTDRERMELDDHVRHMMHSRRSKFKRSLRGFGQYVRRPLGFFVTLYATLITLFGLIWVLLLIGWISVGEGDRQKYILHIVDSVLVALFAIMGDGLAPFRAVDTYHMCFIMHYARIVRRSRRKALKQQKKMDEAQAELKKKTTPSEYLPGNEATDPASPASPSLKDLQTGSQTRSTDNDGNTLTNDDTPELGRRDSYTLANNIQVDVEDARSDIQVYQSTPLTPKQQKSLYKHQTKLAKSHSFYRPNETSTHYAFPLNYAIAVIFLLDFHSCLQISLGATTWGIDYHTRNEAITTVILCVSITVNIIAGLVITIGGRKTRKVDVWERMTRQELTSDAIKHLQAKQARRAKRVEKGEAPKEKKPLKVQLEKEQRQQDENETRANPWA